jgi:hypothetical protein
MHVTDANRWLEGGNQKMKQREDGGRHWARNPAALRQKGREEKGAAKAAKPHNQMPNHAVKFVQTVAMLQ